MAYTRHNWECGEDITDVLLNNMEDGIEAALECCEGGSSLPEVTSADDGKVLTVVDGEWDKASVGYECTHTVVTSYFEGDVTTVDEGDYADAEIHPTAFINADHIVVTVGGIEYECDKTAIGNYGAPYDSDDDSFDFSEYPFGILSDSSECFFNTQTAGTYSVKIEEVASSVETSECFKKAVKSIVEAGYECVDDDIFDGQLTTTAASSQEAQIPYSEIIDAPTIKVVFNGVEYELTRRDSTDLPGYYEYRSSATPFTIISKASSPSNYIHTNSTGTFNVKISIPQGKAVTTPCFCKAVNECVDVGYECSGGIETVIAATVTTSSESWGNTGNFPDGTPFPFEEGQTVIVNFNGTEYKCKVRREIEDGDEILAIGYVDTDGFRISYLVDDSPILIFPPVLDTSSAGTYSVQVMVDASVIETSECFKKAVKSIVDAGFECVDDDIFNGSLTTTSASHKEAQIPYNKVIDAPTIKVVFNGVEYELTRNDAVDIDGYEYKSNTAPFKILSDISADPPYNYIHTNSTGTFDVKVTIPKGKAVTTECFCKAVNECVGDIDKGYECTETKTVLADESITTTAKFIGASGNFATVFDLPDNAIVTFDGVEYECENLDGLGDIDGSYSEYPFSIYPSPEGDNFPLSIRTPTAGTYSVKVEAVERTADVDPCFCTAVHECVSEPFQCIQKHQYEVLSASITTVDTGDGFSTGESTEVFQTHSYPEVLYITFDGELHECKRRSTNGVYGSLSKDGFQIRFTDDNVTELDTATAGTHTIRAETVELQTAKISDCFKLALEDSGFMLFKLYRKTIDGQQRQFYRATFADIQAHIMNGHDVVLCKKNYATSDTKIYRPCIMHSDYSTDNHSITMYTVTSAGAIEMLVLHASASDNAFVYEVV